MTKRRWIDWLPEELAWIEAHRDWPRAQLHCGFNARFGRDVKKEALAALCKRNGWLTGRSGCFPKGSVPQNKGKKMPFNPNSAATQFKKGGLPPNTKHLGHERVNVDGYVEISIAETNPHTGFERRYVHKHRHLWELANGPVPEGMRLKCLDGNRQNTDPSNWEAIPMALAPRLNGIRGRGYDHAPSELKPLLMTITKLEHAARTARKEKS